PHFEAWIYRTFGRGIAEHFMIPYNRRQWAWDLKDMNYDWIAERVPMPKIEEVLLGALKPPEKKYGPNQEFWYPAEGGIEALPKAFLKYIPEEHIWLNAKVRAINPSRHEVILEDGRHICYGRLISTIPLPALVKMLDADTPAEVTTAAAGLKNNIVHAVNIGLEGTELGVDKFMHWSYFPEEHTVFHRISFPHHFSEWMAPPECCSIQAEISESIYRSRDRATLIQETLNGLVRVGILSEKEILPVRDGGRVRVASVMTLNPAYVIYNLTHHHNTRVIKDCLRAFNIETRGRFGEWEYMNMDHAILSGKAAQPVATLAMVDIPGAYISTTPPRSTHSC
ncbi:MAG: FAD-dependent oxidoreductase, partial [candidate division NC10 bacterium]|nr:FAD-dependent oxidoreductase [candidate division NC10 bacterium]